MSNDALLRRELFEMQWDAANEANPRPAAPPRLSYLTNAERSALSKAHFKHGGVPLDDPALFRNLCATTIGLYVCVSDDEILQMLGERKRAMGPFAKPILDLQSLHDVVGEIKRKAFSDENLRQREDELVTLKRFAESDGKLRDVLEGTYDAMKLGDDRDTLSANFLHHEPWEETSRRLFYSVGGNPDDVGSSVPFQNVRSFVENMLRADEQDASVQFMLDRLERVYRRLTLPEFTMEIVNPLRTMCSGTVLRIHKPPTQSRKGHHQTQARTIGPLDEVFSQDIFQSLCAHLTAPKSSADIKLSLNDLSQNAQSRRRLHASVVEDPKDYFAKRCTIRTTPLPHLVNLDDKLLTAFVTLVERRRLLLLKRPQKHVQAILNAVLAAAKICSDHDIHCQHCAWVKDVVSRPTPVQRSLSDVKFERFSRSFKRQQSKLEQTSPQDKEVSTKVNRLIASRSNKEKEPSPPKQKKEKKRTKKKSQPVPASRPFIRPTVNEAVLVKNIFVRSQHKK